MPMRAVHTEATEYEVSCGRHTWKVQKRSGGGSDPSLYAVVPSQSYVLNLAGEVEYEPFPSSRTNEFIARTRFTLKKALSMARKYIRKLEAEGALNFREDA